LPKTEEIRGARILIVWDGKQLTLSANVGPVTQLAALAVAQRVALDKLLQAGGLGRNILDAIEGGS
jgi:hypothetical protein